jgi:hypothetical protein
MSIEENRFEKNRIIVRIIFKIGILHQNHVTAGGSEAGAPRLFRNYAAGR